MSENLPDLDVRVEIEESAQLWSQDLTDFNYSLFILPEFLESFKAKNRQPVYFNFYCDCQLVAKASGLVVDFGFLRGKKLFFFSGPAIKEDNTCWYAACMKSLINYVKKINICRIIFRSYDFPLIVNEPVEGLNISTRSEFIIDLRPEKEIIFRNFKRKVIRMYKKCITAGYRFRSSQSPELLDKLYELLEKTRKIRVNKGYHTYSYLYFQYLTKESIKSMIKTGIAFFFLAENSVSIDGIILVIMANKQAFALLTGVSAEGYKAGVPSMMKYNLVNYLKDQHYNYLNLGGSPNDSTHSGIAFFKLSLGCKEIRKSGFSTNYLLFPYLMINPLLILGRKLPDNRFFQTIKRMI
jgi:hypothetical protein